MRGERRRHIRVPGPFGGWHVGVPNAPVRIMDLSEGGCFIHSPEDPPEIGHRLVLKIDFPDDASLTLGGETLYVRPGVGYAVLFTSLPDETHRRLERAVEKLRQRIPPPARIR